ncbi:unnamed protein product [Phyllotreta striolata]|uniref:MOSC domain-containing protein n=1 Tax=Phyllotreta striolata TaxID=444603 RepID=A0A9N9TME7_PHYSR|nr:unnamed protein product [Phyllotreta striolata]
MTVNQIAAGTTVCAGVAVLAYFGMQIYQKKKRDIMPWKWEEIGTLGQMFFYPLKSGHRIELERADCTVFGLRQTDGDQKILRLMDRCLVVYSDKDYEFRTARTYPQLLSIDVAVHDEKHVAVDAPTMRTLYVKIPNSETSEEFKVKLHKGEQVHAMDCGDEAALWFSRYILEKDSGLRLAYHDANPKHRRDVSSVKNTLLDYYKNYTKFSTGLYSDQVSLNVINQASVKDLQQRISTNSITVNNFRPNLVIDGPGLKPYDEDDWEWVKIGDVVLRTVKDCTRCMMTTIDPTTTSRNLNREPLKTLESYRISNGPDPLPVMGLQMEVRRIGQLNVGEKVFVARKQ